MPTPRKGGLGKVIGFVFMAGIFGFMAWAAYDDKVNLPKRLKAAVDERTRQFEQVVKAKFEPYLVSDGYYPNWTPADAKRSGKPLFAGKVLLWGGGGALDVRSSTVIEYGGFCRDMLSTDIDYSTNYRANRPEEVGTVIFILSQQTTITARYTNGSKATEVAYRCCAVDRKSKEARLFTVVEESSPPDQTTVHGTLDGRYATEKLLMKWMNANVQ